MAAFTDHMKSLTDEVFAAKGERFSAVTRLKEQAAQFLYSARQQRKHLGEAQQNLASRARSARAAFRRDAVRVMQSFRADARRQQDEARTQLEEMLRRNLAERTKYVGQLLYQFHVHRQRVARDFQEAAQVWQQLRQRDPLNN